MRIHNQSRRHMEIELEMENPSLESRSSAVVQLAPSEIREIGQPQGWTFVSGETLRLKRAGYATRALTIP